MIAIFVAAVEHGGADFLRHFRVEDLVDTVGHQVADAGRNPMSAADQHFAGWADVKSLERLGTNSAHQSAVVVTNELDQPVRDALSGELAFEGEIRGPQMNRLGC